MDHIFDHEAFQLHNLTTAYNYSTPIESEVLDMFRTEPVEHRTVMLVKSGHYLQVLMPGEIGQHPNIDTHDPEEAVPVVLIRYPFDSAIVPDDLSRIKSLKDKKLQAQDLATLTKSHMGKHRANHRYTAAFTAYSALKGIVKNKKGDVLVNLHSVMGTTPRQLDLKLGTPTTDVPQLLQALAKKNRELCKDYGHLLQNGTTVRIGSDMIYQILMHASVEQFYGAELYPRLLVKWADDPTRIKICGINFIADEVDEVVSRGASYPNVQSGLFAMLRAPADVLSGSTKNRECYITTERKKHDEGLEIRSRAIYLPIVRNPQLICELHSSN
ncbi:major capsid protein [Vibrio sp. La 4.2.2]|uniref:major capsid protein n=1 Tax=Vibrio sp. La 4.2.2 TaxID=2998830 RepID=UPI0022CE0696|nr:major capsid protein [Vibrio sp. La 4.2.2]MDA0107829.1 major capsid protein [Vibrio sp. La 4.2.2]